MGLLVPDQVKFCTALGSLLGFSQRVIGAWCLAEDSGGAAISKAASGDNNWLNVEAFDSGWSAFATAHKPWATPTTAAQTTWHWINTKADATGIRKMLLSARHKSDGAQLAAIINSTWTGNLHYGGGHIIHSTYSELSGFKFPAASDTGSNDTGARTSKDGKSSKETRTLPYEFSRGTSDNKNEDSWDCIERLAQEVKWNAFMRNGKLWYVSDQWLSDQPPKYLIHEFARGIDDLTFNVDTRGQTDDCTFHCEARRYAVSPGDCVLMQHEGPADGPWIVYDVTRDAGSSTAEVKIRRPIRPLPEPAPQTQSKTITTSSGTGGTQAVSGKGGSGPAKFQKLLYWCNQVSSAGTIYLYGGGHGGNENDYNAHSRFDCSGSVSFVLFKAGFIAANQGAPSYGMYGWGQEGPGKYFTLWCANGHTFLEIKQGSIFKRFDTVPQCGHPATGPRLWTSMCPEPISGEGEWHQRHFAGC